jgi:hypothetical protein
MEITPVSPTPKAPTHAFTGDMYVTPLKPRDDEAA